jgi:uncharacterized protein
MLNLKVDECRALGVLIEKAMTTPENYPLSLNALTAGCNQKNNRDPVMNLEEDRVFEAAEGLRGQGVAVRVDQAGSRVHKYKHALGEKLNLRGAELAILAELMLRGPQTLGEIRGRASRMQALESLEVVKGHLDALAARAEPLVRLIPGGRTDRYGQLLCPDAHSIEESVQITSSETRGPGLTERVEKLEAEVESLKAALRKLASEIGTSDPLS